MMLLPLNVCIVLIRANGSGLNTLTLLLQSSLVAGLFGLTPPPRLLLTVVSSVVRDRHGPMSVLGSPHLS